MNLIGNAITYTPEQGHVETEIYQENNEAVIKIADDGIGIPEKDQGSEMCIRDRGRQGKEPECWWDRPRSSHC